MKNLLIGSQALQYWDRSFKVKLNSDWDIISTNKIESANLRIETHSFDDIGNDDLMRYASESYIEIEGQKVHVVNPIGLAIVKRSHLWRDRSFEKHITQYHRHLIWYRAMFTEKDIEVLNKRTKLTALAYPQPNPNLMQSVEDFFDDAVTKEYNHDYLHELIAYNDEPLYKKMQKCSSSVTCDVELWYTFTHEQKLQCIAEEAYVISIERFLVKNNWDYPAKLAYLKSVNKICTTLCSGWFRSFAIDNYPEVLGLFDIAKVKNVKEILLKD
jgi:hypothetical protein